MIWTAADAAASVAATISAAGGAAQGGALAIASLAQAAIVVAGYVWTALALGAVFRKTGVAPWIAWVPIWNLWHLYLLAGLPGWWAAVLAAAGIVAAIVVTVIGAVFAQSAFTAGLAGDLAGAGAATAGALVASSIVWLALLALVLVVQIRMLRRVNAGFGLGTGSTVLGALVFPLWASVVGWGSARWLGLDRPRPTGDAPLFPRQVAEAAPETTAARFAPPTPFAAGDEARSEPAEPAPAASVVSSIPWAPPAPPSAPAAAPPATAPERAPEQVEDADERTVLAAHRRPAWSLALPDGTSIALTGDAAVLGRNPLPPAADPSAQVVPIADATRTVSKTHAILRRVDEGWTIEDLASTNGVFVPVGDEDVPVTVTTAVRDTFHLGDATLVLRRDGA